MQPATRNSYLETEVMTASPQKLQLTLIEAAMRSIERARRHWRAPEAEEDGQAREALIRAQQIVTELLAGLNHEVTPEVTRKVAAVYLFVFRRLVDAQLKRDEKKLDDAVRVLEIERETWREVCRGEGIASHAGSGSAEVSFGRPASEPHAPPARPSADSGFSDEMPGGLSLEA